jgi:predicted transposase
MKTTVNAVLINISTEQEDILNHLQTLFSSAVRFAYQRLLEGVVKKDIQKLIQEKYGLNSRYASDTIEQARQLKLSQARLLDMHVENWQTKVKAVKKKIAKTKKPEQIPGLQAKLAKREKKLAYWMKYRDTGTLPKVIFGG